MFAQIVEDFPDDPLGARNLLISRLLALKENVVADREAGVVAAREALTQLREAAPGSATTFLLAARLAQLEADSVGAAQALSQAVELAPGDPGLWYELATARRDAGEPFSDALDQALELAPDNLAILSDWLVEKAGARERDIVAQLETTHLIMQPFAEIIRLHTNADLAVLIEEAIAGVEVDDWPLVNARVRMQKWIPKPGRTVK